MTLDELEVLSVWQAPDGRLYQLVGYWTDPVVMMQELRTKNDRKHNNHRQDRDLLGGIGGLMWEGFKKLEPR